MDFLAGDAVMKSVSLVLDDNNGQVTLIEGSLPDEQATSISAYDRARQGMELTGVEAAILHGSVAGKHGGTAHAPTDELIGLRNRYHYSPEEVYEHVYLNNNFYTWHCIQGSEAGLGDTDRCHYIKIAQALYLFVWREKIVPTLGVILIDMKRLKTTARSLGTTASTSPATQKLPRQVPLHGSNQRHHSLNPPTLRRRRATASAALYGQGTALRSPFRGTRTLAFEHLRPEAAFPDVLRYGQRYRRTAIDPYSAEWTVDGAAFDRSSTASAVRPCFVRPAGGVPDFVRCV